MPTYNQNSGYGNALLNAVHSAVPTFGRVFVVFDSANTDEENYFKMQDVIKHDPAGVLRFYTSLSDAYTAAESNNNDVIVVDNNSSHVQTTKITVSKNRLHFIGLDFLLGMRKPHGQGAKITIAGSTAGNDGVIENTGVRNSYRGLKFESTNTSTSALWAFKEGGEFTYFDSCHFVKNAIVTTTTAADLLMNGDSSMFFNCMFGYSSVAITANGNRPCVDLGRETISGKVCRDGIFDKCIFMRRANDSDNSFIYGDGATDVERMLLVRDPIFWQDALASANMDECISCTAQTNGTILVTGNIGATGTPASISTSTGVFIATAGMDGTTPEATA